MWSRLDDAKLRNAAKSTATKEARTYGPDGALWPRVGQYDLGGYRISFSRKSAPGEWWDDHFGGLPMEILSDLPDLIQAFLRKVS